MQKAFSLVELSIVLVILGLLTGGILAGQSLIRAAELRAVAAEFQRFSSSALAFRDKYFALPGDMNNATRFWGDNNTACPDGAIPNGTPGTCNGNGNGQINYTGVANGTSEDTQFWNHLALAGMIEGSYTGLLNASAGTTYPAAAPLSKLSNGGWYANSVFNYPGDAFAYALDYGNHLMLNTSGAGNPLRPEEAWNLDTKIDDGKPAMGSVIARFWNNDCAAADDGSHANNDYQASYRLTDSTLRCMLYFRKIF